MFKNTDQTADEDLVADAKRSVAEVGDGRLHTVGAALRTKDGQVFSGVNVYAQGGGACAELVVLGMAVSAGKSNHLETIVAVGDQDRGVIPPCGVCRQMLLDYAPGIEVITEFNGKVERKPITELLPFAYRSWFAGSEVHE